MLTQDHFDKDFTRQNQRFFKIHTKQFAFYQAGRCLVQTLLFNHPKISLLKLVESDNFVFSTQDVPKQSFGQDLKVPFSAIETRINLETLLIGFYAGKASERFTDYTKIESDVSFCSLRCKDEPVAQRFTYKKEVFVRKTKRKKLIHVDGLFANGAKVQAKRDCSDKEHGRALYVPELGSYVRKSQARVEFGSRKSALLFKNFVFARQRSCSKPKFLQDNDVVRTVRYAKACNKSGFFAGINSHSLISKSPSVFNNKDITVDYCLGFYGQPKSLLPLQYALLCNQHKTCLLSLGHFSLHNQLDTFKIESFLWQSDTGFLERIKAAFLIQSLLFKGSIYLPNLFNLQKNNIVGNLNTIEIQDKKSLDLLKDLEEQTTNIYLGTEKQNQSSLHSNHFSLTHSYKKGLITKPRSVTKVLNTQALQYEIFVNQLNKSSQANSLLFSKKIDYLSQKKDRSVWCEENVCKPLTSSIKRYGNWFRIYLPQIKTDQQLAKTSFLHSVSLDQFFKKRRELGFSEYTKVSSLCKNEVFARHASYVKDFGTFALPNTTKSTSFCNKNFVFVKAPPFYAPSKISFLSVFPLTHTKFLDQVNCYYTFLLRPPKTSFWCRSQAVALQECTTKFYLPEQVLLESFDTAPKTRFWSGFQKVQATNEFESVTQVEVPPHLQTIPQTFKDVWPQELGYGSCHKLVLNVFSRTLNLLNKNRELLDIFADHLIRFGKIRAPEISRIGSLYLETGHK